MRIAAKRDADQKETVRTQARLRRGRPLLPSTVLDGNRKEGRASEQERTPMHDL